ncbi:hypothetical protein FVE85_4270 [Porphyridium purpureum]|uniref:MARVEL domain-containing protein n=1 Tax=Porphyridium purpureum TaxID=35688 RepID=A0A5J4YSV0_PORPP|nr:hypothetical protein FVE85_4270 [Porphyridium purpureum]|eukprot:POR8506..scf229_5
MSTAQALSADEIENLVKANRISPYGLKIATQLVMWISSIIVFGSTSNSADESNVCTSACAYAIISGLVSFIYLSILLLLNLLTELSRLSRRGFFTYHFEAYLMYFLILWWTPAIANIAQVNTPVPSSGIVFGWVCFFASMYGSFEAYHTYVDDLYLRTKLEAEREQEQSLYARELDEADYAGEAV